MAQVTITISSQDAETILFALTLRSKQAKLSQYQSECAYQLGSSLDVQFTKQLGWDKKIDRMALNAKPIKRVTITCYDFPPEVK